MPKHDNRMLALIVCMLIVVSFLTSKVVLAEEFSPIPLIKGIESLKPGDEAPLFKVKDIYGEEFDFAAEVRKYSYVLVFWSIYCEPCREEMPLIEKMHNLYNGKGLTVLTINLDGDPFLGAVKGFIKQGKYSFRVLMDELEEENFKIADPYNVAGTPVVYIIDSQGKISFTRVGRITEEELLEEIGKVVAAK